MENVPKKIYLQVGEDCPDDVDFNELVGVSWCSDRINENDLEFILVTREGKETSDENSGLIKPAVIKSVCDEPIFGRDGFCMRCGTYKTDHSSQTGL